MNIKDISKLKLCMVSGHPFALVPKCGACSDHFSAFGVTLKYTSKQIQDDDNEAKTLDSSTVNSS